MFRAIVIGEGKNIYYTEDREAVRRVYQDGKELLWIDLLEPTPEELADTGELFGLASHCLQVCREYSKGAGFNEYDEYLFLAAHFLDEKNNNFFPELDIFLSRRYMLTVHYSPITELEEYWQHLLKQLYDGNQGLDFLLYNIFDAATDTYLSSVEKTADMIEDLEEMVTNNELAQVLPNISAIRKKLIFLRRQLNGEAAMIEKLNRPDLEFITKRSRSYMRQILEKVTRTLHFIEVNRELTSSVFELYLTMLSLQANETAAEQNKIMQRLTVITAIFMPLTLIAGIYGMNFRFMPELEWPYGYFLVLLFMLVLGINLYVNFKKMKWLD